MAVKAYMLDGSVKVFEVDKEAKPVPGRYIFYRDRLYYGQSSTGFDKDFKLKLVRGEEELVVTADYVRAYARVVVNDTGVIDL